MLSLSQDDSRSCRVQHREQRLQVRGDEVGGEVLLRVEEDVPGEEEQDDGDHDDGVPRGGGFAIETRPIRQVPAVHALQSHPLVETDVQEANAPPRQKSGGSRHVGEVAEDGSCAALERHVGQTAEQGAENDGDPRKTVLGALDEDSGRSSGEGETVQSSRRRVQVGGGG